MLHYVTDFPSNMSHLLSLKAVAPVMKVLFCVATMLYPSSIPSGNGTEAVVCFSTL